MMLVGTLRVIHKWFVVRDIVSRVYHRVISRQPRVMLAAYRAALRVYAGRREAALKPAPVNTLRV